MNWLRKLFGFVYLLNKATGEVHRLSHISGACGTDYLTEWNERYITKGMFLRMMRKDKKINGCIHCNKKYNKD